MKNKLFFCGISKFEMKSIFFTKIKSTGISRIFLQIFLLFFSSLAVAEKITFTAKNLSGTAGNKNSTTILQGDAQVITESMEIFADSVELSGKDFRFIRATGNVRGSNIKSKMDFTCGTLFYDRKTKVATLEDLVNMIDTENDVNACAEIIEYDQDAEVAIMQIKIELTQKDNVCTGAHAVYKKKEQLLELSGNPQIVQKQDTFRAQIITLDMDTQEITLFGRVKGSVVTEEKKDSQVEGGNSQVESENSQIESENSQVEDENFAQN